MGIVGNLNSDQLQFFDSQGFLVIESFASPDEIDAMRRRMEQLLDGFDCSTSSIFSTVNQRQLTDDYFFESAENISFFFEEKAFQEDGNLKQAKELSINKVGHALHEMDPVFKSFSDSEKALGLLLSLGYKRPIVIQSMYIFKQPGIGGEVVPHQDNSFLYTEPTTCTGLWLALEDAKTTNGCLWAIPGSHKNGLVRRFLRGEKGVYFDQPSPAYEQKDFVPIEVKAGSLVVIHGDLIHQSIFKSGYTAYHLTRIQFSFLQLMLETQIPVKKEMQIFIVLNNVSDFVFNMSRDYSFENQSPKSRHAYSLHVVDTDGCVWAQDNWIRRKVQPEPLYES